jgi:hypothetical protein
MLAAGAAFFLLVAACAPPPKTVATISSPSASVAPSPTPTTLLAATAPTFHVGEVGLAYSPVSFSATGGVAPYKWSVASGALPGGLTLGSDGSISGSPTAGGTFTFTIAVSDSGDSTAKVDGKISIADALTAHLRPECSSYCNVELGCVTACGNFGSLTGGVGPYSFKVTGGTVPAGTSVVGFSLSGTFIGQTGWVQFTVQASDALGATTTISPKFWMYPHISLAGGSCYQIFTACSVKLAISGGVPNGSPSVALTGEAPTGQGCWPQSPTPLPAGYTLTVSGGYVNLYIPRPGNGYGAVWTLVLTDHTYCSAGSYCTSSPATVNIGIECT